MRFAEAFAIFCAEVMVLQKEMTHRSRLPLSEFSVSSFIAVTANDHIVSCTERNGDGPG